MKYSNYKTVNQQKDATSVDWCLSAKPGKSYKQASVQFSKGKAYQYGTNYATAENDVVVVGNVFPRGQNLDIKSTATTGRMGVVTLVAPKITTPGGKVAELDFVFSRKATKRMVAGCIDYLDGAKALGGNNMMYGKFYVNGCIHPISISIRKTLAAASILAHASLATPDDVNKAKDFITAPKEIGLYAIYCEISPEGYADIDFRDIQVDVDGKNEDELEKLNPDVCEGVYYREEDKGDFEKLNQYVDKYTNIGAVSLMVRGGFVNLLKAYLSVNPPIGEFYDEMLEAIGDNGYPEALAVLREYHPAG